ncbi:amino acid permease [Mycoplasma suis]|uniref:Amino acid permease n=1 Tax=Mycoplasma suis (strain Illinois) TaxID=768700 RepID=F0QR75_MYCSL|nr:amino acid permease [Mycoplasma suis]ADX97995.1 amino acid permease [Mycoplasma suis str. Illinois]
MSLSYSFGSESNLLSKRQLFILSLSSMIGIGVFIKSKTLNELSSFNFQPLIALFVFSAILISSMIFLFTKLINKYSSTGRSFIEWVEGYCGKNFTEWSVRFTKDFAHPLGIITTAIYLIKWIAGANFLWVWESALISLLAATVMISLNTFSFKVSEKFQRALFFSIIISLIFVFICGIISIVSGNNSQNGKQLEPQSRLEGFNSLGGWTILLSGLPSIFFMYDGFYSVLSLKEQSKSKTSFTKIILYSLYTITAIYLLIITITLFGDKNRGDFQNFSVFSGDKNWKDVLTILIFLTFASSLNIACMCSQNQLIQLHYKYDFKDINKKIRKRLLNRGENLKNFHLEVKLSSWCHIIKKMIFYSLLIALVAQMYYWCIRNTNIFWDINDMLAELVSLFIFFMLAVVIWKAKEQSDVKLHKALHYLVSYSIFAAIAYYVVNTAIDFYWNVTFLSWLKMVLFAGMVFIPAKPYLKTHGGENKSWEKVSQFRKDNPLAQKFNLTTFSQ